MQRIRPAVKRLNEEIGLDDALASQRVYTDGAELIFDDASSSDDEEPLTVVRTGQEHFADVIRDYLQRISYGDDGWAARPKAWVGSTLTSAWRYAGSRNRVPAWSASPAASSSGEVGTPKLGDADSSTSDQLPRYLTLSTFSLHIRLSVTRVHGWPRTSTPDHKGMSEFERVCCRHWRRVLEHLSERRFSVGLSSRDGPLAGAQATPLAARRVAARRGERGIKTAATKSGAIPALADVRAAETAGFAGSRCRPRSARSG